MANDAIPPELQKLIGSPTGDPTAAPMAAPMSSEQPREGDKLAARNQVTVAMTMLEQALMAMGSHSEEGRVVMDALMKLSKTFHKENNDELMPAQLMSMMQSMPQVGGGTPEQMALMQAQSQGQGQQQPPGASAPQPQGA